MKNAMQKVRRLHGIFSFQNSKYEFFSVPTERAAIATGNDLRGLGICHQQALAGIPETGFLLNTQSYVRLHCLPVVLRVFGRESVYSCRIDKPLITAYNRVIILNCYNREMQKNKIFCPL